MNSSVVFVYQGQWGICQGCPCYPGLTCPVPCLQLQHGFAGTACSATLGWQHLKEAALQAQLVARGTVRPPLRLLQVGHALPWHCFVHTPDSQVKGA